METHPFHQQAEAKRRMDGYAVQPEAWAPFCEARRGLFENPILAQIAQKHHKTTAQMTLRWHIQRHIVVIPKSARKERMRENLLDKKQSGFFSHQDPAMAEWFQKTVEERKGKY